MGDPEFFPMPLFIFDEIKLTSNRCLRQPLGSMNDTYSVRDEHPRSSSREGVNFF